MPYKKDWLKAPLKKITSQEHSGLRSLRCPKLKISLAGILKLLAGLDPSKAADPDTIKPIVLRPLKDQVAPIHQAIFQHSLHTGQIPSDWQKAIVIPLFKKGYKCDPGNYRPISLTCIYCKLMEHIIASNLTKHLNKHNVLYDLQHGFREKRSCETQLILFIDELARGLSIRGQQTDIILLDFSKAFDKVSHTKLLFKLHQHGITQNNLSWIKAFLLGRSQCVALEGEKVQVGKDQEKAQSEKDSHSKNRGGKKPN